MFSDRFIVDFPENVSEMFSSRSIFGEDMDKSIWCLPFYRARYCYIKSPVRPFVCLSVRDGDVPVPWPYKLG